MTQPGVVKQDPREAFALDVLLGLSTRPKNLSPKYLYDEHGSRYFQEICDSPEYYPTDCEAEIFATYGKELVGHMAAERLAIVELGAGDGRKTKILLRDAESCGHVINYFPIDISESALQGLVGDLRREFPDITSQGIYGDYFAGLKWLGAASPGQKVVLFLGGNIGNFSMPEAKVFLKTLSNALNHGDLALIGFDLKKDIDVMLAAYNDAGGATRRFNLNLLERMNRELGANFDIARFSHFGTYNVSLGAMESFLISLDQQDVYVGALDTTFRFKPYEAIHVEYSMKFLLSEIETLAKETGFEAIRHYSDTRGYFVDSLLRVRKNPAF